MDKIKIYAQDFKIPCEIYEAKTFWNKFSGLMLRTRKYGLLIEKCNSVHTFFMKFNIDVVCIDKDYKIVEVFYGVKPFRFAASLKKTKHILELPSGAFDNTVIKSGISLKIVK